MSNRSRAAERVVFGGLLFLILISGLYLLKDLKMRQAETGSGRAPTLPIIGRVSSALFTDQNGNPFNSAQLLGKIWFADVVFTRCAGPCPEMTRSMRSLQERLDGASDVHFVTMTSDPDHDGPEQLKRYGEKFSADFANWHFLTGAKKEVYDFCINDLKLVVVEKEEEEQMNPEDLFIHSTLLVLVDAQGNLRGSFDGFEKPDFEAMLNAVDALKKESSNAPK